MRLSDKPSWAALNEEFRVRRMNLEEFKKLLERVQFFRAKEDGLHRVPTDGLWRNLMKVGSVAEVTPLQAVGQFYTFHSVNYGHRLFQPAMAEVFATMPGRFRNDERVCGVSLRVIYGATAFGSGSWHVCLATAYHRD